MALSEHDISTRAKTPASGQEEQRPDPAALAIQADYGPYGTVSCYFA